MFILKTFSKRRRSVCLKQENEEKICIYYKHNPCVLTTFGGQGNNKFSNMQQTFSCRLLQSSLCLILWLYCHQALTSNMIFQFYQLELHLATHLLISDAFGQQGCLLAAFPFLPLTNYNAHDSMKTVPGINDGIKMLTAKLASRFHIQMHITT